MGITELLWLFFMFSAIQPVIQQKLLEASRLRLLRRFERSRKSRASSCSSTARRRLASWAYRSPATSTSRTARRSCGRSA